MQNIVCQIKIWPSKYTMVRKKMCRKAKVTHYLLYARQTNEHRSKITFELCIEHSQNFPLEKLQRNEQAGQHASKQGGYQPQSLARSTNMAAIAS